MSIKRPIQCTCFFIFLATLVGCFDSNGIRLNDPDDLDDPDIYDYSRDLNDLIARQEKKTRAMNERFRREFNRMHGR